MAGRLAPKVIFFDAVGTLIHLPKSVGHHYALVGRRIGLPLSAAEMDRAFAKAWNEKPARLVTGIPRADDDKGWWRELVNRVLDDAAPATKELDRDNFFEIAYEHFAEAGVWELYPEVREVITQLQKRHRLAIVSNFDGRLRMILDQLGLAGHFAHLAISSEIGADKPDPFIYRRALELCAVAAHDALHVGDDPIRDWEGASAAGIPVYRLKRPQNSLRELLTACAGS